MQEDEILALTTVARAVWYLEHQITHLDRGTYQWVDIKTFGIGDGFNDITLIKNTSRPARLLRRLLVARVVAEQGGR